MKAGPEGLTFKQANGHYTLVSAPGNTYQQNGQWQPAQLQVAAANDGSGWLIQGSTVNASLTGGKSQTKDLAITSGAVAVNFHVPQLTHNGDNTFSFREGNTQWLLRAAESNVGIEAAVAKRLGKGAGKHSFGYQATGAIAKLDTNGGGGVDFGGQVHITRPVIVGADRKFYYVCTPWSADEANLSFSCDDSTLPDAALPYVIDPTWTSSSQNWSWDWSPIEHTETNYTTGLPVSSYFSWEAHFSSYLPNDAQIISENVDTSGLSVNTQSVPGLEAASCSDLGVGVSSNWVFVNFLLSYTSDTQTHGCIATVNGAQTLSATIEYWEPTITPPTGPIGPSNGFVGTAYGFNAGNAYTSSGYDSQYLINWGDGTNTGWLPVGTMSASHAWSSVGTYTLTAQARDSLYTDVTATSQGKTVVIGMPETVSAPTFLNGPTQGVTGAAYTYTTGGSVSSLGNPVQYKFTWSAGGPNSGWLDPGTTSATVTWATVNQYQVSVVAQTVNTHVVSPAISVSVAISTATYTLTAAASPLSGGYVQLYVNGSLDQGPLFSAGTQVMVHAVPYTGFFFNGFGGDLTGSTNDQIVTMSAGKNVTASFVSVPTQVLSNPPGATLTIDGGNCTSPCTFYWAASTAHTLSVTTTQNLGTGTLLTFAGWSDGLAQTHTVAVGTSPTSYTVSFNVQYYLTTTATTGGTISPASGWYNQGQSVLVTATPNQGYPFVAFAGALAGTVNPQYVVMASPKSVVASFVPNVLTLADNQHVSPEVAIIRGGPAVYVSYNFYGDPTILELCESEDPQLTISITSIHNNIAELAFSAGIGAILGDHNLRCLCFYGACSILLAPVSVSPPPPIVAIYLEQVGQTVINPANNYSEDTTIRVTAVDSVSGATLTNFTGTVNIAEDGTHIYEDNGGTLPSSVVISSGGSATFVAKSLAGPEVEGSNGSKPHDAVITAPGWPIYHGELGVTQWVISGKQIDPKAAHPESTYDWFQTRARDIFANVSGQLKPVMDAVLSYSLDPTLPSGRACQTDWDRRSQSPISCNPLFSAFRLGSAGGTWCGNTFAAALSGALYHEARHAYQASLAAIPGNDVDGDYLVNNVPIAPADVLLDTTTVRNGCDISNGSFRIVSIAFSGDAIFDAFAVGTYAWEMDAFKFAAGH